MVIIIFIFILALLILIHELGHFIAAKKNGVKVEEFGLGFPPRILAKQIGETIYSLNIIPLGGFVKLYGEEYVEADSKLKNENPKLKNKAFVYKKPWQKAVIIIAGVLGNFLLGWLLISYLFTQGIPVPTDKVIIEKVQPGSPAQLAGLKEKDLISSLVPPNAPSSFIPLKSSNDFIRLTKQYAGKEIQLLIKRENKQFVTKIIPRKKPPAGQGPLGVVITSFAEKKYHWYQAPFFGLIEAFKITKQIVIEIVRTIYQFILFQKPQVEVAGPIGIASYTAKAITYGYTALMQFVALLSLNLAVINILPFPALDGGRLIFVLYEWVTKKRVNQKIERYVNLIGIIILLSLAILVSINDMNKIIRQ